MKRLFDALPADKSKEFKIWLLTSALVLINSILVMIFVYCIKLKQLNNLKSDYFELVSSVGDFDAKLGDKKKLKDDVKYLEEKMQRLQTYSSNGSKIGAILLESICNAIPEQLFLDEINFDYKNKNLSLIGFCQDVFLLTEFADKIAEFSFCKNVRLEKLSRSLLKDYVLQFVISIQLKEI